MPTSDDERSRPWDSGGRDDRGDRPRRRDRGDDDRPRRRDRDDYDGPPATGPNGLATAGLILGVLAFCTVGITAIPGLVCSVIALGKPTKRGTAVTGLILSILGGLVGAALGVGLLMVSVQKVREAAARMNDQNNLKQISLAAHNYNDANAALPPANGPLSWRVHLLPYIEHESTYRQFDLDQPWDGPTNKPLADRQIKTYVSADDPPGAPATRYRVFVGPNTLFPPGQPPIKVRDITDGTANTIYAVEAGETVPWPQPKELAYSRNGPLPALGFPHRKGFNVAFADGSVRFVKTGISETALRAGIEPTDGRPFTE